MDNKRFIATIRLCKSLNELEPEVLDKLETSELDLKYLYTKIGSLFSILIDGKDYGSIGGIFIKDKKLEYVKVYNDNDYRVLLNRVIKGDHDLVMLPNPSYRDTNVDDTIDMLSLNNNDYLEYLLLYGDLVEGSINTLNFMQIYNSSMKYAKIMSLFRNRGMVDNVWLSLLKEVDDRIKEENKVEEVYDVLKLKFPIHKLLDEIRLKKYVSEIQKHPEWDFDRVVKFIKEE